MSVICIIRLFTGFLYAGIALASLQDKTQIPGRDLGIYLNLNLYNIRFVHVTGGMGNDRNFLELLFEDKIVPAITE